MTAPFESPPSWSADVVVPLSAALIAAAVAAWPWWVNWHRARRFHAIIRRELRAIGPRRSGPAEVWWWQYLAHRFVHEEFVARPSISENRDFLLTLNPDVLYHLSQLWIAFDKGDHEEWQVQLKSLSKLKPVQSDELTAAAGEWESLIKTNAKAKAWEVKRPPSRDGSGQRENPPHTDHHPDA